MNFVNIYIALSHILTLGAVMLGDVLMLLEFVSAGNLLTV